MDMTLDHLKGWIGREESASELLTPVLTERFLATFDRDGESGPGVVPEDVDAKGKSDRPANAPSGLRHRRNGCGRDPAWKIRHVIEILDDEAVHSAL